jgi:hypothetical protein
MPEIITNIINANLVFVLHIEDLCNLVTEAYLVAFIEADIMYSPTLKLCAHFSAYSLDTSLVLISILLNPALSKYIFSSSTEEAPVTQPQ